MWECLGHHRKGRPGTEMACQVFNVGYDSLMKCLLSAFRKRPLAQFIGERKSVPKRGPHSTILF